MLLAPGGLATVLFSVSVGGVQDSAGVFDARVFRDDVETSLPVSVVQPGVGEFVCTATIPANWPGHTQVWMVGTWRYGTGNSRTTRCPKFAGTIAAAGIGDLTEQVAERTLDLLEADQSVELRGTERYLVYRLSGTPTVLMEKRLFGTVCADDVQLVEP